MQKNPVFVKQQTNSEWDFSDKLYLKNKTKTNSNEHNHVITIQHKGNRLSRQHGNMVAVCACRMCCQKTGTRVFYLLWVHADTFHWLIKFPHKNKQSSSLTEGYALFKTWDIRHETTMFCHLQTRIINPSRLDSILTAYLNILAVLESFKSLYILYKTKTRVASNEHSFSHPITGTHIQTRSYK